MNAGKLPGAGQDLPRRILRRGSPRPARVGEAFTGHIGYCAHTRSAPAPAKGTANLKESIDDLDDLRDVQVMLVEVSETPENFADLKSFEIHLQERERKLLKLAKKQILALKLSELKKRIETIREALEKRKVEGNFPAQLLQAVDHTYARTLQVSAQVDASQPGTIHRLRLAFQKIPLHGRDRAADDPRPAGDLSGTHAQIPKHDGRYPRYRSVSQCTDGFF